MFDEKKKKKWTSRISRTTRESGKKRNILSFRSLHTFIRGVKNMIFPNRF